MRPIARKANLRNLLTKKKLGQTTIPALPNNGPNFLQDSKFYGEFSTGGSKGA
mgnify:CR=1 FL=1